MNRWRKLLLLATGLCSGAFANDYWMYVGTYTNAGSAGIYVYKFHSATGLVEPAGVASGRLVQSASLGAFGELPRLFSQIRAEWPNVGAGIRGVPNPSFLAVHPSGNFLYVSNENDEGAVSAFRIDRATGKLTPLNTLPTGGSKPSYVNVDNTGRFLLVANFLGGSVATFRIEADGSIGRRASLVEHHSLGAETPLGPHPHSIYVSADDRFALAPDLGLDRVFVYRFDPRTGALHAGDSPFMKAPPGSGPRHLAFHPNGEYVYVLGELGSTVTIAPWNRDAGALDPVETIRTLPPGDHPGSGPAEIIVRPDGRFLYVSNRGYDTIAVFEISEGGRRLTPIQFAPAEGRQPRGFRIDPESRYLFAANTATNTIVQFRIDRESGRLTPAGRVLRVIAPTCIRFVPAS